MWGAVVTNDWCIMCMFSREMLNPGGHFMVCDVMEETWYAVNNEKFSVLGTTQESIETAFLKNGFKIEMFEIQDLTVYPDRVNCDAKSLYYIIGKKL